MSEQLSPLLTYFSSPRNCERHAPPSVVALSRQLQLPVWKLYRIANRQSSYYRSAMLPKASGGFRMLDVPCSLLKTVQRRIYRIILAPLECASSATAYRKGCSVPKNAAPHTGKPLVLKLDIADFFGSITYALIRGLVFTDGLFPPPAAILLASLCTLDDLLPQGAPTSPALANLVMKPFDGKMERWCGERQIAYTRYCDDMTFSGLFSPEQVIFTVASRLKPLGMELNEKKTRLLPRWKCQSVTGLVVNEGVRANRDYRRALRQTIYYCQKFGLSGHLARLGLPDSPEEAIHLCARLLGQTAFVLSANPGDREMAEYRQWLTAQLKLLNAAC